MTQNKFIRLRSHEGESGASYVELQDHPHELVAGIIAHSVDLHSLIENYDGPRITLDFDTHGRAIGIEILYPLPEDDE